MFRALVCSLSAYIGLEYQVFFRLSCIPNDTAEGNALATKFGGNGMNTERPCRVCWVHRKETGCRAAGGMAHNDYRTNQDVFDGVTMMEDARGTGGVSAMTAICSLP